MKKLNCVLLIDDDEATNFYNEMIISNASCARNIISVQSGQEALDFLSKTNLTLNYPQPDLIFLDINMPKMNGWEFLELYDQLPNNQKGKIVVVMLTNSINPDDQKKANGKNQVSEFNTKPLNEFLLSGILQKYFPEVDHKL